MDSSGEQMRQLNVQMIEGCTINNKFAAVPDPLFSLLAAILSPLLEWRWRGVFHLRVMLFIDNNSSSFPFLGRYQEQTFANPIRRSIAIMANTRTSSVVLSLQLTESSLKPSYSMFWLEMRPSGSKLTRHQWSPSFTTRSRNTPAAHLILIVSLQASALTTNSRLLFCSPILSIRQRWIAAIINQIGRRWTNMTSWKRASPKIHRNGASIWYLYFLLVSPLCANVRMY